MKEKDSEVLALREDGAVGWRVRERELVWEVVGGQKLETWIAETGIAIVVVRGFRGFVQCT